MPRGNVNNLTANTGITPEEMRERNSKAGKASAKARAEKKLLKDCLEVLLEREISNKKGETITGAEAISVKVFEKALKGDLRAFEMIRDTVGQKPVEKIAVADIDASVIAEVDNIVAQYDERTSSQVSD